MSYLLIYTAGARIFHLTMYKDFNKDWWRAAKFKPMLEAYGHWAGWDLYGATTTKKLHLYVTIDWLTVWFFTLHWQYFYDVLL